MLLEVKELHTFYEESHILRGISFSVANGELVTLLGRNGAGKTTAIKSIIGLVRPRSGEVIFDGDNIVSLRPHAIARKGIGFVPEDRRIFKQLTVSENLELAVRSKRNEGWSLDQIYQFFQVLKVRRKHRGSELSGGEQQVLAIARILRTNVKILLLDEPTEGLAPVLVKNIGQILKELRNMGKTMLLVEQNILFTMGLADRHYILSQGSIVYEGTSDEIKRDKQVMKEFLGV